MRIYFLTLLFPVLSLAQYNDGRPKLSKAELQSLLQGDWYLSEAFVSEAYDFNALEATLKLNNNNVLRKISISGDSLIPSYDKNSLHFPYVPGFTYQLLYDSTTSIWKMDLFVGYNRKHRERRDKYELLKYNSDEIILKSLQSPGLAFGPNHLNTFYVWRRKGVKALIDDLDGKWFICADDYIDLPQELHDTINLNFSKNYGSTRIPCEETTYRLELNFFRLKTMNVCSVFSGSSAMNTAYLMPYIVRSSSHILFGAQESATVFDVRLKTDKLILQLNKDLTEKERNRSFTADRF